ncbi:MAG TPA: S-layer homology domain-containing protein, partial [Chloroflexia bacterium]|nr:S-layer homology domain-containing protein [Chloroflexia bacterium]
FIIIHDTEGSYQSAISWFQNASSGVSAHYVIRSSDGDITQMVHNADTAYHAGNWDYNVRAIGVEHEGYMNQQGWYTPALYAASAALVRTMADRFSIHKDHAHIIGHYQVPNQIQPPHVDPGPNWDWAGYLALVRNDAAVVARVRNIDGGFDASPGIIDAAHGWSIYNGGWNGGQAYRALSTTGAATNMATWTATLPAAGLYDVYAYIPWVDNGRAETSSARYTLNTPGGAVTVTLDQKALTDAGVLQGNLAPEGEWAHLGRFNLSTSSAVALSNATGDSALNVWFDTLMWIPAGAVPSPTPPPTNTALPTHTPTRVPTATPSSTATPVPTDPPTATWTPGPCGMSFSDLPDTNWAYPYVSYLYCSGIISGYGDGTFRGGAGANRGQLTKMLALGMGWAIPTPEVPSFVDVPLTSPYFYYVEDAYAHGAVSGYADGTFRPYAGITRAQLSKMIVSAKGWPLQTPDPPSFVDVPPTYWAFSFIETAHAQGIVGGYADGTFRPGNPTTRAQLAKMLSTALQSPNPTTPTATVAPSPSATDTTGPATSTSTSTSTPVTTTVTVTATSTP